MSHYVLSVGATYADLDDDKLDRLVREIQDHIPMCCNRQMQGQLLAHGIRVQQYHMIKSMKSRPRGSRRLCAIETANDCGMRL